jgi:hypothetical protein
MLEFLSHPLVLCLNAFLTGVCTKLADVFVEHGYKTTLFRKMILGILWGLFGSLVVLGNSLLGAFYLGILLSWIFRYKLDYYNHGIGGVLILGTLFWQGLSHFELLIMTLPIFVLFTVFGLLSREKGLKRVMAWFHAYNMYSFLYLGILLLFGIETWIVIFASLANVLGYHGVKYFMPHKE